MTPYAVRYRPGARGPVEIEPLADIYRPERTTGASVVLVHGGGFVIGSRRMKPVRYLAAQFAAAGIAVCAIDYRMIFRGGRLAEATADVVDAFHFWCAQTDGAVSLVGLSAGATLALHAAMHADRSRLAAVACCFGLYEVDHLRGPARLLPHLLRWPGEPPLPAVPTLLLHGDADRLVPVGQARRLAARREALGLPTRLVVYPGAPHGFFRAQGSATTDGVRELVAHVLGDRRLS